MALSEPKNKYNEIKIFKSFLPAYVLLKIYGTSLIDDAETISMLLGFIFVLLRFVLYEKSDLDNDQRQ